MQRFISVCIFLSFSLIAQDRGEYSIGGVVVNARTGEPVKYALVHLTRLPVFNQADPSGQGVKSERLMPKSAQAGAAGEFAFHGLAKAKYVLSAQKPGFAQGMTSRDSQSNQIDLTDNVSGLQVKLSPLGVIEGKVVDQDDEPLRGVQILALQSKVNNGWRETNQKRSVATDDRGIYRMWNLEPGRYYIKAAGKTGGTYRYVADTTPYYSSWQGFAPVYTGGARTLDEATPVTIEPGTNATADFHLTIEPAFRIRGTVQNAPSGTVKFELLQGTEHVTASRSSLNVSTGKFEIQDVTPGAYVLRVEEEGKLRGEVPVAVGDSDVNDVAVSLSPPVSVSGVVRVVGGPVTAKNVPGFSRILSMARQAGMTADQIQQAGDQPIEANCTVSLHQAGAASQPGQRVPNVPVDQEKGTFRAGDVFPGVYRIQAECFSGYVTAIMAGGIDLLANSQLSIQPGAPPPLLEVQVKAGGGTLTVVDLPDGAEQGKLAGILTVPSFTSTGPRMHTAQSEFGTPEKKGFMIPFLAPGDYTVYAFADFQAPEYRNPAFLQALTGGVSVHIEDGKEQHISLTELRK